jgi:hypothetical protein
LAGCHTPAISIGDWISTLVRITREIPSRCPACVRRQPLGVDESPYYEYVLKRAGIRVHYCAEFENDGSMSSSVLKTLKRSMAAE